MNAGRNPVPRNGKKRVLGRECSWFPTHQFSPCPAAFPCIPRVHPKRPRRFSPVTITSQGGEIGHHQSRLGPPRKTRASNSSRRFGKRTAERIDYYGQEGELWQYPYALNERDFSSLTRPSAGQPGASRATASRRRVRHLLMNPAGDRDCSSTIRRNLASRRPINRSPRRGESRSSTVNYHETNGTSTCRSLRRPGWPGSRWHG